MKIYWRLRSKDDQYFRLTVQYHGYITPLKRHGTKFLWASAKSFQALYPEFKLTKEKAS